MAVTSSAVSAYSSPAGTEISNFPSDVWDIVGVAKAGAATAHAANETRHLTDFFIC